MTNTLRVLPSNQLYGLVHIPGDKSITHRALILGALYGHSYKVLLNNYLSSWDCSATLTALQDLGVHFSFLTAQQLQIDSVGLHGLRAPSKVLDAQNSGTTMRLLTGVLVGQNFSSTITGDASLCKRPMRRIIDPLTQMGAQISAVDDQYAPLQISGVKKLQAINYSMPIASAQVKSAILLASLYARGNSTVTAPSVCRDHTEIMLQFFAATRKNSNNCINIDIPSDLSSAAFFIVGATIAKQAEINLTNIGINPTRSAVLTILQHMGADIQLSNLNTLNGELRADINVRAAKKLLGLNIPLDLIANAIDELPIICLASACAHGVTVIRGAQELRYKESDRIALIAQGLSNIGIQVSVFSDGLAISGGLISGGNVDAGGDHRIAMTFAMAGLVAQQPIIIHNAHNIATSFPDFVRCAQDAGLNVLSTKGSIHV